MLIQFRFKNFKSFKEETILDLSATKITEHSDHVYTIGDEKILPVAAIYGANASGKSNAIEAFGYMRFYVLESFKYGGYIDNKENQDRKIKQIPFAFDKQSQQENSLFEVYFVDEQDNGKFYNYGFISNKDGIVEEWLNYKAKTAREYKMIFYRNQESLDLSGLPKECHNNIEVALEKETLIVSLGSKLKIEKLKKIYHWFYKCKRINFGNPQENMIWSRCIPHGFADDKKIQDKVVKYLSTFDDSIVGFHVEVFDDEEKQRTRIDTIHRTIDGGTASIPLRHESSGTLKMFALYPVLEDILEQGGVLLIDELNGRLHPLLARNVILTFLNPELNTNHAQLVFSTHDSWQLSNNLLRRDEIWFTEKDNNGVSTLYSLADFVDEDGSKIRKDECYEKNYLIGKYGAIPDLKSFDMFKEG